jgi:sulfur carrier protein ThiS
MLIMVRLFGTLSEGLPNTGKKASIEMELPENAIVSDLLSRLNVSKQRGAIVTVGGIIAQEDTLLSEGVPVMVFDLAAGG